MLSSLVSCMTTLYAHWLEYEVTADLHKTVGERLVLGAEMFETDNQLLLDEYLSKVRS